MEEIKPEAGRSDSQPEKGSGRDENPDEQIPIFSRNLEVNSSSVPRQPTGPRPEKIIPPMKPADRILYFEVEAGKVLEILRRRISGLNREPVSLGLVKDIYQSWCTLWEADDKFPVGPFTEMFDIAFSILSSMSSLSRKFNEEERSVLVSLVQAMSELAEGKAEVGYLDSCRMLVEKSQRLGTRLELESGVKHKAPGLASPERSPGLTPGKTPAQGPKLDISSAVDEWFDQVSSLMEGPGTKKKAVETSPAHADSSAGLSSPAEGQQDTGIESEDTTSRAGIRPEVPFRQAEESGPPAAEPAVTPQAQSSPAEEIEPPAPGSADDGEPVAVQDVVFAYFRECCDRSVVIINRYLERLDDSSPKRTSRVLSDCLEELINLSKNLGIEDLVDDLFAMREALGELSRAPKVEIDREKARVRAGLCRLVDKLKEAVFSLP